MTSELLLDARAAIAESPTWVADEGAVYWIDVKAPALHRLALAGGAARSWPLPDDIGAFALAGEGGDRAAVVALRTGIHRLDLRTGGLALLAPPPFDPALTRFNEGACDSRGRFWVGTMFDPRPGVSSPPVASALCSFTLSGGLRTEPDAADLHNGMAWSADGRTYYLSHSKRGEVFAFPFDPADGKLGHRRSFAVIPEALGVPDGAAVDTEGGYWCAVHGGARLRRYLPDGALDREVMLPVSQPTMCAFAGPELDLMVVTSASDGLTPEQLSSQPHAGGLFRFRPGVGGIPRHHRVS